jgi:hypothetical protein
MKRLLMAATMTCAGLLTSGQVSAATVTVDPGAPWLGFMNVFELPSNGGGFVFGSGWGTADLVATFSGDVLTLAPNSVNDASTFWYQGGGGPGAPGNKIMDANFYQENDSLNGQTVTFHGNVLSNSFTSSHNSVAFIKEFVPNYSSSVGVSVPLTPGPFSITFPTSGTPGHHIQFGFTTRGPNVWVTDVGPFGSVQITAIPEPASLAVAGAGLLGVAAIRGRGRTVQSRR